MKNKYKHIDKFLYAMSTIMWGCIFLFTSAVSYIGLAVTYNFGQFAFWFILSIASGWLMLNAFKLATR